jgi:transposase
MRDTDVFQKLLGITQPWVVDQFQFSEKDRFVDVYLGHRSNARFSCPECGRHRPLHDHTPWRMWRHVDSGIYATWVHARVPRVGCPEHGIRQVRVPWALPLARYTTAFERKAIDTLQEADVLGASRLLKLGWDMTWNIMARAVERGQAVKKKRVIAHLGVDEKAVAKRHRYFTLVSDIDRGTVEYIAKDRKKASLDAYYQGLTTKQRQGIQAVAMDMWEPFIESTVEHVSDGRSKIVFDRYHIMTHLSKAVDQVRKQEHRRLLAEGDDILKRTKYLWLFAEENLPERYEEWFEELKRAHLQTGRAWAIKEALRDLWSYQRKGWALRHWKFWYYWATHSRLKPVVDAARTVERHLDNVLTYLDHRITNATSEGLNSKIQTIKKTLADIATRTTS